MVPKREQQRTFLAELSTPEGEISVSMHAMRPVGSMPISPVQCSEQRLGAKLLQEFDKHAKQPNAAVSAAVPCRIQ